MKALGLSFSVVVFAALVVSPAEAGFRSGFGPVARIGPSHGSADFGRERRRGFPGGSGFGSGITSGFGVTSGLGPDAGSSGGPQFVPFPVPYPVPVPAEAQKPSEPHLILIGASTHARPLGKTPKVIYGDSPQ